MNIVIYARYSSSGQREESIEGQVRVCEEYARQNNYIVIDTYCDRAFTGKNDERPAFKRLLADSSKKKFQAVLVYSIDRFARNLYQSVLNEIKLQKNGVILLSATENFTDDPSGRLHRNIMMSFAQYYSDELAQKIKRGMDINAEKCLCTGGNVALGYNVGADKHFQIDPETAPIVQMIYEMYADGKTVKEITTFLNSQGLKTSKGAEFNKNSLHTILTNRRYIGMYTYKGKETPGGMPQIISDELFNKVAEKMAKNRKAPARAKAKVEYLLTTKLFCGHCKEMMTGYSAKGKQGRVYNYYICNGKKRKLCDKKMVNKDQIENLVITECRKLLTSDNIQKISQEVVALCEAEKDTTNLKYLKKLLSENERRHKNTIDAIMECDIESVRKALYAEIPRLEKEHAEIEKQIAIEEKPFPALDAVKIKFFLTQLKNGDVNDIKYRRTLVNIFINAIYLYDDRMTITFNSADEPITVSYETLSAIEERDREVKNMFLDSDGPPKRKAHSFTVCALFAVCRCIAFI